MTALLWAAREAVAEAVPRTHTPLPRQAAGTAGSEVLDEVLDETLDEALERLRRRRERARADQLAARYGELGDRVDAALYAQNHGSPNARVAKLRPDRIAAADQAARALEAARPGLFALRVAEQRRADLARVVACWLLAAWLSDWLSHSSNASSNSKHWPAGAAADGRRATA